MTNDWQAGQVPLWAHRQSAWTAAWHDDPAAAPADPSPSAFDALLEAEHRANFDLWHEEDKARNPAATDAGIASVKHRIDAFNQQRNDLIEQLDEWLLQHAPPQHPSATLHSETPGMMLDRLSILALKIFHTRQEADRDSATEPHRERNRARLAVLEEQRADLTTALEELLQAITTGERRVKMYRQMKMYNDPDLNPEVYRKARG